MKLWLTKDEIKDCSLAQLKIRRLLRLSGGPYVITSVLKKQKREAEEKEGDVTTKERHREMQCCWP